MNYNEGRPYSTGVRYLKKNITVQFWPSPRHEATQNVTSVLLLFLLHLLPPADFIIVPITDETRPPRNPIHEASGGNFAVTATPLWSYLKLLQFGMNHFPPHPQASRGRGASSEDFSFSEDRRRPDVDFWENAAHCALSSGIGRDLIDERLGILLTSPYSTKASVIWRSIETCFEASTESRRRHGGYLSSVGRKSSKREEKDAVRLK